MVKAFYLNNAYWEIDFFLNDIFDGLVETVFFDENIPLFIDPSDIENNILVINDSYSYEKVEKIVKKIKPFIIFHLSDETGKCGYWAQLSKYTKNYFRQHNNIELKKYYNAFQMPLGYGPKFISKSSLEIINSNLIKPIRGRPLDWAFVGTIKYDRYEMCSRFKEAFNNGQCITGDNYWDRDITKQVVKPSDMAEIYKNAIFIPNGRGNISLDCFRIYEAVVCGAIPVIIGTEEEIKTTFYFNGNIPYFIRAMSWIEAVNKCKSLLNNLDELENIQKMNFKWWKSIINNIRNTIKQNL
jgi:hypothetical protein